MTTNFSSNGHVPATQALRPQQRAYRGGELDGAGGVWQGGGARVSGGHAGGGWQGPSILPASESSRRVSE